MRIEPTIAAFTLCGGAGVAAWLWFRRRRQHQALLVDDCQAAFPTAQWVCAMRANDAASAKPKIGSNIEGAGPDTLAATLSGNAGKKILDASVEFYKATHEQMSSGLVERTLTFDGQWMAALDEGVDQFVILAAGLDARAWRLPRMNKAIRVFEVDVPRAHAYKAERLACLDAPLACTRVAVEADLSDPRWVERLCAAGFDPAQRSFFLVEGLLMYLPPGAPEALLSSVARLMSSGSTLAGDAFVNMLAMTDQRFVRSLGTKWTSDFSSQSAITALLAARGLVAATVRGVGAPRASEEEAADAEAFALASAKKLQAVMLALRMWPAGARAMTVPRLLRGGEDGVRTFAAQVAEDRFDVHGLAAIGTATRARIVELVLTTPLPTPQHGTTAFGAALLAEAKQVADDTAGESSLRRWWSICVFAVGMMRRKVTGATHVTFAARKA